MWKEKIIQEKVAGRGVTQECIEKSNKEIVGGRVTLGQERT